MPPVNDNFADAIDLDADGALHTISGTTVDATLEAGSGATTETDFYGSPNATVWYRVDLSAYPVGLPVEITLDAVGSGAGYHPYGELLRVIDPAFDENNPDFGMLDYTDDAFFGDGTANPPQQVFTVEGGPQATGAFDEKSETGVFYLVVGQWDYDDVEGDFDVEYSIEAEPYCVDAPDVLNPASATASVVDTDYVRETWDLWWDFEYTLDGAYVPALTFTWAGPAGTFKVLATGRMSAPGPYFGFVNILVRVNGRMFCCGSGNPQTPPDAEDDWSHYPYQGPAGPSYDDDYHDLWIVASPGDQVEVFIGSKVREFNAPFAFIPYDLKTLCFLADANAPASGTCTPAINFPTTPLGDVWGSPMGWGGQKYVPDDVLADNGITPYDEGDFAWGVNWHDYDFAPLEDGTVYLIAHDESGGSVGSNHYVVIKKYDPGGDDWTELAVLNSNPTDPDHDAQAVSIEYDGTYVHAAWWESATVAAPKQSWEWHLVRIDPSDDSITELGTGQAQEGVTVQNQNYDESVLAPKIVSMGSGGDIFVAAVETTDDAAADRRMIVWHWDGSSWTNLNLPDPTDPDIPAGPIYEATGENGFYDQLAAMIAARADGPCDDGFTLTYTYRFSDPPIFVFGVETISYTVGVGWHDEIISKVGEIEGNDRLNNNQMFEPDPPLETIMLHNHDLHWHAGRGKLVLTFDLVGNDDEIWDVWQLNDDGDQWELFDPDWPASTAMPWRQSRNTARVGPDGEVYRAMWAETVFNEVVFEPKVAKTCPGYNTGFASAPRNGAGEGATEDGAVKWQVYLQGTYHVPIKFAGGFAYTGWSVYAEGQDADGDWNGSYCDGLYVFKMPYQACGGQFMSLSHLRAGDPHPDVTTAR